MGVPAFVTLLAIVEWALFDPDFAWQRLLTAWLVGAWLFGTALGRIGWRYRPKQTP